MYIRLACVEVIVREVLWDVAGLVDSAAPVTGPAGIVEVAELVAELAEVEGLTGLSVMVALAAPVTCIELNVGAVSPWVIELVMTGMDFISTHEVSGGIFEDYL